ncbi:MAG TPA: phosphoribosylformylglycinamidine synthase I [Planctomycetota bacterium]|nr:phosphoribosylformylglycinamidine synthase I [Planctomycetota bacterium]
MVKALVVRTAGTNTDLETVVACEKAGFRVDLLHVNRLVERPALFGEYQLFIVPGGFSYGDDLGSGRVFANEIRLRLMEPIREFVRAGNLVLGICNGFQVLVKSGLLPDPLAEGPPSVTLTFNDSGRFEDRWVRLKAVPSKCVWVTAGDFLETAVTHGEGKFVAPAATLDRLEAAGQVVLKYVDASGAETGFPINPNGSLRNIAGICDPTGRVLGLMPHPEKHLDWTNHPRWTRKAPRDPDGLRLFRVAFERLSR